ncbi:uncharacterized protein MELLADRAFT_89254 [Melampsora larici-populina 98AG31]|uniref:Alcohol dehydrogenase-like C-terminal domain-containing protein n=1 Tax=Melampsora larici-populina (strain 98AG31 / pathotype 3-4-7) TaxID=747676 RepID=F4R5I4_MELLP|nr:uncharacterized protein MELLADRAFT_89254 [Melampsora larici-populina 98AG31]EGG12258.1 hypothetical protein MELLADRAFT_89254 [Melampsora larici-populina 98AG31]
MRCFAIFDWGGIKSEPSYRHSVKLFHIARNWKNLLAKCLSSAKTSSDPADIILRYSTDTIQGRYPWKPKPRTDLIGLENQSVYIAGNEGLGVVEQLGSEVDPHDWRVGDWVIMGKPQLGTWQSHTNLKATDLIKLSRSEKLTEVQAATMAVNLATAFRLIKDYYHPEDPHFKDGWIIQNGANSSVGQFVIQLCKAWGIGCIGFVRDRPEIESLRSHLIGLGQPDRTKIITHEEFESDESLRTQLKSLNICLGFNCVSGSVTNQIMKVLRPNSSLVTYGGMSMKPITVPTASLIFKNLQLKGFMLTQSLSTQPASAKADLMNDLLALVEKGQVSEQANAEIIDVDGLPKVQDALMKAMGGKTDMPECKIKPNDLITALIQRPAYKSQIRVPGIPEGSNA